VDHETFCDCIHATKYKLIFIKNIVNSSLESSCSCIPEMTPMSLAAALAPRTDKIIKNSVFERAENLLPNGILHFVFKCSQSSKIVLQSKNLHRRKTEFSWHLKG